MTTATACFSSRHCRLSRLNHLSRLRAAWPLLLAAPLLALWPLLPGTAWAQAPVQYGAQYGAAIDPPGRVARLNLAEGAVSFASADAAGAPADHAWSAAQLNRPLTSGDRLWTGAAARAELHIGSTALRMSEQTSLDFVTLDDDTVQLRLAQGSVQLRVRTLFESQRLEVNTPNLAFVITQPGNYRLDVDPSRDSTRVVVLAGAGVLYGDSGESVNLGSQQQANFSGTRLTPAGPGAAVQDSFDAWAADRDRREDQSVSARYVPRETLGYQQLDSYGDWRQDATYGAIWLPRALPLNWAPYRMGHWSWIAPWGWTWIDDAPWGFAPFHYGRWAQIGPRWAWVPGRLAARPVYAPALVVFLGGHSGGVNWNIAIGAGGRPQPGVGWFPLAPGEAFRPAYRASPRYVTRVNNNIVIHNTVNASTNYRYQRQPAAVTATSRDDFVRERPVRGNRQALSANDLNRAQVLAERNAIPQRPDARERPRPAAASALPPAALLARPVVGRRDERRDERRDARNEPGPPDRGDAPRAQTPMPAAPLATPRPALPVSPLPPSTAGLPTAPPAANPAPASNPQERSGRDAESRARREQQQLQREQERPQGVLSRPQEAQRRQAEEAQGQRALREQVPQNGNAPPPTSARPVDQEARAAAERSAAEQALRAQQQQQQQFQLQREQQRQQAELARQQDQQKRHNDELAGQRAMREQAQRQQAQQQLEQQAQARQQQEQQHRQQALQQQRAQQELQRRNEELQGQRAQQEQQRQQQAQQRAQQEQQRQAHEQAQRQEQRRQRAEEKQRAQAADAARVREPRSEGGPNRQREP